MGLWAERVVPFITDKACNTKEVRPYRERQCADLRGDVLEIGFGSGHTIEYLPDTVHELCAIEPSDRARAYAAPRIAGSRIPVRYGGLDGQHLELPDDHFDCAVSTCTLCTIPDAVAALREVRRVLKPGGTPRASPSLPSCGTVRRRRRTRRGGRCARSRPAEA